MLYMLFESSSSAHREALKCGYIITCGKELYTVTCNKEELMEKKTLALCYMYYCI